MSNNQLTESGQLRHFLTIEGLKRPLLVDIMDRAEQFSSISNRQAKKVPLLRGKTIVNLFFENSTRTRTTFFGLVRPPFPPRAILVMETSPCLLMPTA